MFKCLYPNSLDYLLLYFNQVFYFILTSLSLLLKDSLSLSSTCLLKEGKYSFLCTLFSFLYLITFLGISIISIFSSKAISSLSLQVSQFFAPLFSRYLFIFYLFSPSISISFLRHSYDTSLSFSYTTRIPKCLAST